MLCASEESVKGEALCYFLAGKQNGRDGGWEGGVRGETKHEAVSNCCCQYIPTSECVLVRFRTHTHTHAYNDHSLLRCFLKCADRAPVETELSG